MDPLGLIISWLPVLIVEPVVLTPILTGAANMVDLLALFPSCGVVLSVPCQLTYAGVWKTGAVLHAASEKISLERIVQRACKVSPLITASPTNY